MGSKSVVAHRGGGWGGGAGRWKPEDQGHLWPQNEFESNLVPQASVSKYQSQKHDVNQVVKMVELNFNFRDILFCMLCMYVHHKCFNCGP